MLHNRKVFFIFFLFLLFELQFGLVIYIGNRCAEECNYGDKKIDCSEMCSSSESLVNELATNGEDILLNILGDLELAESLQVKRNITISGGSINMLQTKRDTLQPVINITVFSTMFTLNNTNLNVPLYVFGKTKAELKNESKTIEEISSDYECFGNSLGKFQYYSNKVTIVSSVLNSPVFLGSNDKETYFDNVKISKSGVSLPVSVDSALFPSILDHLPAIITVGERALVNNFTVQYSYVYGAKILNNGLVVNFEDISNSWKSLAFTVDQNDSNKYYFYPLMHVTNPVLHDSYHLERQFHSAPKCRNFYSKMNKVEKREYALTEWIDESINKKSIYENEICVVCKNCDSCLDFLDSLNCRAIFNSIKSVSEYQLSQESINSLDINYLRIEPSNVLSIKGNCLSCDYLSVPRTIKSMFDDQVATLYCDKQNSDSIIKYQIQETDQTSRTILVNNLILTNSLESTDRTTGTNGIQISSMIALQSEQSCGYFQITNNTFRNLNIAVNVSAPQHCSSLLLEINTFISNKKTLLYNNNFAIPLNWTDSHIASGEMSIDSNFVENSGEIRLLDKTLKSSLLNNVAKRMISNNKRNSKFVVPQLIKENSINPKISKNSSIKNVKEMRKFYHTRTVPAQPPFPLAYKITNNFFRGNSKIFHCSGLNGISFSSNQVEWIAEDKTHIIDSLCDELFVTNNVFFSEESLPTTIASFGGVMQIISSNKIEGKFRFLLGAGGYDEEQLVYKTSTASYLVSNNTLLSGVIFQIPDTLTEEINLSEKIDINDTTCLDTCDSFDQLCWKCINQKKDLNGVIGCFEKMRPCNLDMNNTNSLSCQSCLLKRFTTKDVQVLGNRVFVLENTLEGCDLSNFLFKRESQEQCRKVSSKNVFFGYNYINTNCTNYIRWKKSDIYPNYAAIRLKVKDSDDYLDEKGKVQKCTKNRKRLDLLNPPKCCVSFTKKQHHYHTNNTSPHINPNSPISVKKLKEEQINDDNQQEIPIQFLEQKEEKQLDTIEKASFFGKLNEKKDNGFDNQLKFIKNKTPQKKESNNHNKQGPISKIKTETTPLLIHKSQKSLFEQLQDENAKKTKFPNNTKQSKEIPKTGKQKRESLTNKKQSKIKKEKVHANTSIKPTTSKHDFWENLKSRTNNRFQ